MRQVSPDDEQGRICPLVAENLADNLLGQHLLAQMEVILMTNYQAFFDTSWKRGIGRQGNIGGEIIPGKYRLLLPPGVNNIIRDTTPNLRGHCPSIPGN